MELPNRRALRNDATDTLRRHHLPAIVRLVDQHENAQSGKNLAAYFKSARQAHALQALEVPQHIDTLANAPDGACPKQRHGRSNVVSESAGEDSRGDANDRE
jgi:hypothetical protein